MEVPLLNQPQKYGNLILRILGILIVLQGSRAVLTFVLWRGFALPDRLRADAPALICIDLAAFALVGGLLFLLTRPSYQDLALDFRAVPKGGRILTMMVGLVFGILLAISFITFPDQILTNLRAALMIPFIEELIFRGVLWSMISKFTKAAGHQLPDWLIFSIVTVVFSVWHLGYVDSVLRTASPGLNITHILIMKLVIGGIVGVLAGLARWRANNLYAAVILHGLWNLFGR